MLRLRRGLPVEGGGTDAASASSVSHALTSAAYSASYSALWNS